MVALAACLGEALENGTEVPLIGGELAAADLLQAEGAFEEREAKRTASSAARTTAFALLMHSRCSFSGTLS
jgi:hypothetical protein